MNQKTEKMAENVTKAIIDIIKHELIYNYNDNYPIPKIDEHTILNDMNCASLNASLIVCEIEEKFGIALNYTLEEFVRLPVKAIADYVVDGIEKRREIESQKIKEPVVNKGLKRLLKRFGLELGR